ncbi:MAG: SRPBCC family protein [Streptomyces sp.]|jgi:ribosome-associated toxin RatA of RatAB toxin-antitoxin module|uniref:type II toxin-antitoxin system RatA family toxin n=1 Tax=Streptomyces sp. TaxID=1931 RepID=UPI0025FFA15D|nr:SRPBCC family protein [Streptomyces sp.]MBW8795397.1 SRPBCC family protein [Streptomyces sp.]
MPEVTLDVRIPDLNPLTVFERLRDFSAYPKFTDAIREVRVTEIDHDTVDSHWQANFRNGVLCWSERDRIDPAALTIEFTQLDGDFERFEGGWYVTQDAPGTTARFTAVFDLGIPTLASLIDPIAARTLLDTMGLIATGLFGSHVRLDEPETVPAGAVVTDGSTRP